MFHCKRKARIAEQNEWMEKIACRIILVNNLLDPLSLMYFTTLIINKCTLLLNT